MNQPPPFFQRSRLGTLLWLSGLFIFSMIALGNPIAWASPVTAYRNQTIPPDTNSIYLPTIHGGTGERNLVTVLEDNGDFSTFAQMLRVTNLAIALEGAGPYTIFAPTDAAFDGLPSGAIDQLLANPKGQLTQIILFHILPGHIDIDDLEDGMQFITQQGQMITIERNSTGDIRINGASIISSNLKAINGVIHGIDTVLLPPPPN